MNDGTITFGIDFDGTVVTHDFPRVGQDIGAWRVLRRIVAAGHRIILWTMRSDIENPVSEDGKIVCEPGMYLTDAVNWFKEWDIPLYGIQKNPTQHLWTHSCKPYCDCYIDDAALGAPLVHEDGCQPYLNWLVVETMLEDSGILPPLNLPSAADIIASAEKCGVDKEWALEILKGKYRE